MKDKESFIDVCRAALKEHDPQAAIRELVAHAVSDPGLVMRALGEPKRAGINTLYRSEELTILDVCWGPRLEFRPHDHHMWAVIGIYAGREQNFFYHRRGPSLARASMRELNVKDTAALGAATIHAVTNPLDSVTAAIHVYGGNLFGTLRSEWDPSTFEEHPYDTAAMLRTFEESNARLAA